MNVPSSVNPPSSPRQPPSHSGGWTRFRRVWQSEGSKGQLRRARPEPNFALARPRRMKGRALSVLLWSLGFYVLAAAVFDVVVDRWCPMAFEQVYRTKWRELCRMSEENLDRPLLVMLGSSRTEGGFQAGLLEGMPTPEGGTLKTYNFGIPAAGPIHEYLYFQQMLERGIKPRLMLVEFLPPLFNDARSRQISEEKWSFPAWMTTDQLARVAPYMVHPNGMRSEWLESKLAPWHVHRKPIQTWLQDQLDPPSNPRPNAWNNDRWGYRYPETLSLGEQVFRSAISRQYMPTLDRFRLGPEPAKAMRDLLECCRREQIPVALVLTPESSAFRSWYSPKCLTAIDGLLADLQAEYGVEVIDTNGWVKDTDFVDGHHLDAGGAAIFTARLRDEVRRMLR